MDRGSRNRDVVPSPSHTSNQQTGHTFTPPRCISPPTGQRVGSHNQDTISTSQSAPLPLTHHLQKHTGHMATPPRCHSTPFRPITQWTGFYAIAMPPPYRFLINFFISKRHIRDTWPFLTFNLNRWSEVHPPSPQKVTGQIIKPPWFSTCCYCVATFWTGCHVIQSFMNPLSPMNIDMCSMVTKIMKAPCMR